MPEPAARLSVDVSHHKASRGYLYIAGLVCTKACVHTCTLTENFFGGGFSSSNVLIIVGVFI